MRSFIALALPLTLFLLAGSLKAQTGLPLWAYGFSSPTEALPPSGSRSLPPDDGPKHLPGSDRAFTYSQIWNFFGPADWYPEDHPPMPEIVAHGHKPDVYACSFCHYPNGKGRSENACIAGLPVAYFIQTLTDFKTRARRTADSKRLNADVMFKFASGMTDEEIKAAAEYFGAMKATPWIKVVETDSVPKFRNLGHMFVALPGSEKEPIGKRIIEVPENSELTAVMRDDHSGFIAYAPVGSIKRGQVLVKNGGGKTTPCAECHGADLQGLGPVPGIAGRSPSYLVRQLYDMQQGYRAGIWTELMKPVVAHLDQDDLISIAAYMASLNP